MRILAHFRVKSDITGGNAVKYSVIDIGSNSVRLTVYRVKNGAFRILFKNKKMAGLAGYVENGCISDEGIERACDTLLEFRNTLHLLGITDRIYVFATASLRNIVNSDEASARITAATGFDIDIITGEQEAILGYKGVMRELDISDGVFTDIGGASTEIAFFSDGNVREPRSYRMGSLKLYKDCVKHILPGRTSKERISQAIRDEFARRPLEAPGPYTKLICTGGTARSVLKFARYLGLVPASSNTMSAKVLLKTGELLTGDRRAAADAILRVDPERIHTIIPGYMILQSIADHTSAKKMIVSSYGVREGYLCQKILG